MRLMTYNIRLGLDSSLERIAQVITELSPDLVCLQEVGRFWTMGEPVDMRSVLMELTHIPFGFFVPALQQGRAQYGITILSRYPIQIVARHPLPRRVDEPRVMAQCEIRAQGESITLVTSHVSVCPEDRALQLSMLSKHMATSLPVGHPAIFAGDLNATSKEPELGTLMKGLNLRSALLEALGERPNTFPSKSPSSAIDWILVNDHMKVASAGVSSLSGSDHLAVWADVEVN